MRNTCTRAAACSTKVRLCLLPPAGALDTALLFRVVQALFPINYILAAPVDLHFLGMKFYKGIRNIYCCW